MAVTHPAGDGPDPQPDALRTEIADLATESIDAAMRDLDLLPTVELVAAMNRLDAEVPAAVGRAAAMIARAVDAISERMSRGGRLVYVGAGTSGRIGVLDASECPPTFGVEPDRVVGVIAGGETAIRSAIENAEDDGAAGARDLARLDVGVDDAVVGLSASGRTPYVLGALRYARGAGALTVAVACNRPSRAGAVAEIPIEVVVGPEFIAGSTRLKAGTAQKLVLNMLSTLAMVRLGKTFGNIMVDMRATNEKLRARAVNVLTALTDVSADAAAAALTDSRGSVKEAALALLADVPVETARHALAGHDGDLRRALGGLLDG